MARDPTEKWGPRLIDIDVLLYGELIIQDNNLIIPHERLAERNFVLVPLMEIAGEIVHPVLKATIEDIYFNCRDRSEVYMLEN